MKKNLLFIIVFTIICSFSATLFVKPKLTFAQEFTDEFKSKACYLTDDFTGTVIYAKNKIADDIIAMIEMNCDGDNDKKENPLLSPRKNSKKNLKIPYDNKYIHILYLKNFLYRRKYEIYRK